MCSIDIPRTTSWRGPLGSKACHTLGQDFDLRTKSQQFEILSFKIIMWTKWPARNVLVFFCSYSIYVDQFWLESFKFLSRFLGLGRRLISYLNVYRRRTWLITNCTRCIYQEFFLERYTIVRNKFTYLALERHAVWILATELQKPVFPDALVRPHLSHIGQIVVPLLSLKSLCYQSNHFVWIVLSPKSFSDFIINTSYSYVWCLLLVNIFHLCLTPIPTSWRLEREPVNRESDCVSHEKAHRSVCRQNWFWSD